MKLSELINSAMCAVPTVKEMATEILFYESITLKFCPVLKMLRHYKVDEKDKEEEFRSSCLLFTLSRVLFCCNRMVLWSILIILNNRRIE